MGFILFDKNDATATAASSVDDFGPYFIEQCVAAAHQSDSNCPPLPSLAVLF